MLEMAQPNGISQPTRPHSASSSSSSQYTASLGTFSTDIRATDKSPTTSNSGAASTSGSEPAVLAAIPTTKASSEVEDSDATADDPQENYACLYIPPVRDLHDDQQHEIKVSSPQQGVIFREPMGLVLHLREPADLPNRPLALHEFRSLLSDSNKGTDRDGSIPWHQRKLDPGSVPQMTVDPRVLSLTEQGRRARNGPIDSKREKPRLAKRQKRRERAPRARSTGKTVFGAEELATGHHSDESRREKHSPTDNTRNKAS